MGKSELKIAVVGAGLIGRKHIDLVTTHAHLAAVVDPDEASRDLARHHGAPWFDDLDACLSEAEMDGVIIASPNGLHLRHGAACLEAGLPVLIEKPLADTAEAGWTLCKVSAQTGVPVLVGHHRRHSPIIRAAKQVIDSGQLGRIVVVNALFCLNKPADYFQMAWRTKTGGGPAYINLIHDIDLLQFLCGPIASVQGKESHAVRGFEVEDSGAAILSFDNGVIGTITYSDTVSTPWSWELTAGENPAYPKTDRSCYMIAGTKGSLSVPDLTVWTHTGQQSWWSPIESTTVAVDATDPVKEQFLHFLDVIKGDASPLVTATDGVRNIEVLDALKRAGTAPGSTVVAAQDGSGS